MSTDLALPESVVPNTWDADTAALMEFSGLTWIEGGNRVFAPSGVMGAFIQAVRRTGLDPTAKQIYAAIIGGKWTILTGVDGMRVVAQRTGEYDGQDPIEWQREDESWSTTPPKDGKVIAARVAVYRKGVGRPLVQTVTMNEFGGRGGNWNTRPAHMLGIRAETHALRRLFPQDLSGLYTPEDFQDDTDTGDAIVINPTRDWVADITAAQDRDTVDTLVNAARAAEELTDKVRTAALTRIGMLSRAVDPEIREYEATVEADA